MGLLQHIGTAVVKSGIRADDLAACQQIRRVLSNRGHHIRIANLDGYRLGFIKLIQRRPHTAREIHRARTVVGIEVIVIDAVDGRGKLLPGPDDAHNGEYFRSELQTLANRIYPVEQTFGRGAVHQRHFAVPTVIFFRKTAAGANLHSVHTEVIPVHTKQIPIKCRIPEKQAVGITPLVVQRCLLRARDILQLLTGILRNQPHLIRNRVPAQIILVAVLVQLDGHHVIAGTDQILFNLLVGTLYGGDNGNDGRNADDDTQHGKYGAELVTPDALKGKMYIFYHNPASLLFIQGAVVALGRSCSGLHVLSVGERQLIFCGNAG